VAYVGQLALFGFPVYTSIGSFSQLALGYASAGRILSIMNTEPDLDQNSAGYDGTLRGEIAFEGVDFGYSTSGKQVLYDVSFSVQPGQTVAIVGQTGSGKTTVTKLINRIYDVDAGRVRVDGRDVREWSLAALRSQISIIEQDIFLFSRSIADNIAFGKPDATREEILAAAQKAQAHEFIMSFEAGYDTVVGQRGVTLSGGQRQRIAIARAFLTDPPVLILDDSTSAIDSATEDKIQQAIYAASEGRTMILITHRLSQIRWADHIVVLRKGRVVAQGAHDALLGSSESYRRIFARYEGAAAR
jgi:ATP-binding cassette subfamily B protein